MADKANPIQVQKFLKGMEYKDGDVFREQLIQHAKSNGADDHIIETLEKLPEDQNFNGPNAVVKAINETDGDYDHKDD